LLYYTGSDDEVHQLYQEYFEVEFTVTNMEGIETGIVAFINQDSGELESASLIASAPSGQCPQQELKFEIICSYSDYGELDEKEIKKPNPDDIISSEEAVDIDGSVE